MPKPLLYVPGNLTTTLFAMSCLAFVGFRLHIEGGKAP
jgi:hypothetical protein